MRANFFVVKREIEASRFDFTVFTTEEEARAYFDNAYLTCWNDADGSIDGAVVTNCWLMWVETDTPANALIAAEAGEGHVFDVCFPIDDEMAPH
jgi:hypothetical protein